MNGGWNHGRGRQRGGNGISCTGVVLGLFLAGWIFWPSAPEQAAAPAGPRVLVQPPQLLSADVVGKCRDLLKMAERIGVIRDRPDPTRINVDERKWAELDAATKDRTLQAVACDVWQQNMPPADEMVVAYGWRSGTRVQMLTEIGMVRE